MVTPVLLVWSGDRSSGLECHTCVFTYEICLTDVSLLDLGGHEGLPSLATFVATLTHILHHFVR